MVWAHSITWIVRSASDAAKETFAYCLEATDGSGFKADSVRFSSEQGSM
jgi:hypothetical protein